MFSGTTFPVSRTIPYLVLKQTRASKQTAATTTTVAAGNNNNPNIDEIKNHPITPKQQRKVIKWIPQRSSDQYISTNMLEGLERFDCSEEADIFLYYVEDRSGKDRTATRCDVNVCIVQRAILGIDGGEAGLKVWG
eukprot:CAMPEP_0198259690 /NCGR_PEP_ID=MMETSP1447-20131203/8812_1 /TAXON_ID=420782 /ORGANISM="Chaetoceros dichaeta, Strain CCMP1751" /LENGTH=135 /DNA_ID=CAMNT_0043947133 /DNA_START=245 /DNA_END=648 /DNA_ORIENTATION=-